MRRLSLGALAVFPAALAAVVLDASPGRALPELPRFRFQPLPGDAYGYYACARALISTSGRHAPLLAAVAVPVAVGAFVVFRRTSNGTARVLAVAWAVGIAAALPIVLVPFTGAAQVGWPLLWSIPLAPLRALHLSNPDDAFGVGLALSLVCNAVTVVASYHLGRRLGLRDRVAYSGAALVAFWPVLSLLAGAHAAANGTWQIDLGLSLYTEPLSTALVVVALVLALGGAGEAQAAAAGAFLGAATLVRDSNVLFVVCAVVAFVLSSKRRQAAALAAGALAWAPAALLFFPKGYPHLKAPVFPAHPFALGYADHAWTASTLWHPAALLVLLPVALLGTRRADGRAAVLLWGCVAATAAFYSFYELTPMHPRFLFVVLPIVLVFWAAGVDVVLGAGRALYDRAR